MVVGVVFIYLCELHIAANTGVFDFHLNYRAVLVDDRVVNGIRENKACRRFDFTDGITAVRHTGKGKTAVLRRGGGQKSSFGGKLGFIALKQTDDRAAQRLAALVLFQPVDLAANQLVLDGLAVIDLDLHQRRVLSGIVKCNGILRIRDEIVAVGGDFLDIQLCAYGNIRYKARPAVFIAACDLQQSVSRNHRAVCGGNVLGGIKPEGYGGNFAVCADAEQLVGFKRFG